MDNQIIMWNDQMNSNQPQRFACDRCHEKKVRCSGPPGGCERCHAHNVCCETTRRMRRSEIAKTLGNRIKELELMVAQKQGPDALLGHVIFRHDLLQCYFDHINAHWPLFDNLAFRDQLHQQSPFLLYAMYANAERLLHGPTHGGAGNTFFSLARKMVTSQLKDASYSNIAGLYLLALYATSTGSNHGLFYFEMAVRLLQVLVKQTPSNDIVPSQQVELLRRVYWLFVEYDHHLSVMWNLPLQMQKNLVTGSPIFGQIPSQQQHLDLDFDDFDSIIPDLSHITQLDTLGHQQSQPIVQSPEFYHQNIHETFAPHHHHIELLKILPLVSQFLMTSRSNSDRTKIDLMLTHWYETLPTWIQTTDPASLMLYYDARILLHKAQQDDTVYTGLVGTEPHFSKLVCSHSAISISLLQPTPDLFRPYVTAALVLMSSFQQGILDLDKEYIMQRVESCVSFLEHLGHSVEIAKWDATKLRQGKNVLTLAMDATFGNIDNSGIVGFEGDENVADYALIV